MTPQELGFLIFRLVLTTIIFGIQFYFFRMVMRYVRGCSAPIGLVWTVRGVFALFNLPLLILIFLRPQLLHFPEWFITFGIQPFYVWHGTAVLLFLVAMVGLLFRWLFKSTRWLVRLVPVTQRKVDQLTNSDRYKRINESRRVFLRRGFITLAGTTLGGTVYGLAARRDYEINEVEIPISNLPPAFHGFTITLIADVHSGMFMTKSEMSGYAQAINELKSDLIAIPGDMVNRHVLEAHPFAEAFSDLSAPFGVYGSLGNHDFYAGADEVSKVIEQTGIHLLRNDRAEITKDGQRIYLLGVDDVGRPHRAEEMFESVTRGANAGTPRILLCHRPYFFEQAAAQNIDLILSGHTHGGQVVFASLGRTYITPAMVASPYVWGLYKMNGAKMYVTRGLGVVGLPIRINCPPEIARITLVKR